MQLNDRQNLPPVYRPLFTTPFRILFFLLVAAGATAQEQDDPDRRFREAQTSAFAGEYARARELCRGILAANPLHHDARVLLARTHAWEQHYDSARSELKAVLLHRPEHADALSALADVERWSGNPRAALRLVERALQHSAGSPPLLLQRAQILVQLEEYPRAAAALQHLLHGSGNMPEARRLLESLDPQWVHRAMLRLGANAEVFRRTTPYGPWHLGHVSLSHLFGFGLLELRMRYASRDFGAGARDGLQVELDGYPRLSGDSYLFVNAGYSGREVFPRTRLGLEYFAVLTGPLEGSLGFRYYDFRLERPVQGTLSGALSLGQYWCSLRGYITSRESRLYGTGVIQVRRYFSSAHSFAALTLAAGSSPLDAGTYSEVQRLSTVRVGLEGQMFFDRRTGLRLELAYEREEYLPDVRGNRFGAGLELLYRF